MADKTENKNKIFPQETPMLVPQNRNIRAAVAACAKNISERLDHAQPPNRITLDRLARNILGELSLAPEYLGYGMICINNSFWSGQFAAIPYRKRILLLPRCLKSSAPLSRLAEALGYRVLVAEGTPQVLKLLLEEDFNAVLGVACTDSLDKAFAKVSALGVPNLALPLLADGCKDTEVDAGELEKLIRLHDERTPAEQTRSYIQLMRKSASLFEPPTLGRLLGKNVNADSSLQNLLDDPMVETEVSSAKWLAEGGKRLRPFLTLAAYAVGRFGKSVLSRDESALDNIPDSVCKIAMAIETMHKASLIHDDIEDADDIRYGHPTFHKQYGIPLAINAGDFLVGLGYRLISEEIPALGACVVADIIRNLSSAHLRLCRGQGAELVWWRRKKKLGDKFRMKPIDALAVYSSKTAPAFESAIYSGLRMADIELDLKFVKSFARAIGVGFQIRNDLKEWATGENGEFTDSRDILAGRPTLLLCFALEETGSQPELIRKMERAPEESEQEYISRVYAIYDELGVFIKAEAVAAKYKSRALTLASELAGKDVSDLLFLLIEVILGNFEGDHQVPSV